MGRDFSIGNVESTSKAVSHVMSQILISDDKRQLIGVSWFNK